MIRDALNLFEKAGAEKDGYPHKKGEDVAYPQKENCALKEPLPEEVVLLPGDR